MPSCNIPPTAASALEMLEEQTAARNEELNQYDEAPDLLDSDDELESECPQIDRFFEEDGNKAIHQMTNFTLAEFSGIWSQLKSHISRRDNTGRGSKFPIRPKDLLFMTMAVLKHGTKWDLMAYLLASNRLHSRREFLL